MARKLRVESFVKNRPKSMTQEIEESPNTPDLDPNIPIDSTPWEINPGLTKKRAKELYMLYYWTKDQLQELGIPEKTLNALLYQPTANNLSWKQERDIFESTTFARMKERCSDEMSKSLSRAMSILNRSLTEADMEQMKLKSPREYKDMIGVVKELKNMINLEEGKPTAITKNASLTQKDVEKLVAELQELDPFIDYDPTGKVN